MRIAIAVSMVSSAFSALLLLKLNGIVHGQLYDFGLQFSVLWASPYWDTERLLYACLAIPPILGGLALAHSFLKMNKMTVRMVKRVEAKPIEGHAPVTNARTDNSMMITCPKCRKVFGRPLNMLDFSKGRAQLVNVCPYCNYVLGSAAETDSESTRVILPDRTEIEQT
jgi:hypothetical protein